MKLFERQREFNKVISKTRCLIECTFGSIRRWFMGGRCRYRGLERTHTQNVLEAMAYNLKRMPRLLIFQGEKNNSNALRQVSLRALLIDEIYYKGLLLICVVLTILRLQIAQVRGIHHSKRHNYYSVASPLRCTYAYRL